METQKIEINPRLVIEPATSRALGGRIIPFNEQVSFLQAAQELINKHAGLDSGRYGDVYQPEIITTKIEQFKFNCANKQAGYPEDCQCAYDESNGIKYPSCCDGITEEWILNNPDQAKIAFPENTHGDWVEQILICSPATTIVAGILSTKEKDTSE